MNYVSYKKREKFNQLYEKKYGAKKLEKENSVKKTEEVKTSGSKIKNWFGFHRIG